MKPAPPVISILRIAPSVKFSEHGSQAASPVRYRYTEGLLSLRLLHYGNGKVVPARHALVGVVVEPPPVSAIVPLLYRADNFNKRAGEVRRPCGASGLVVD